MTKLGKKIIEMSRTMKMLREAYTENAKREAQNAVQETGQQDTALQGGQVVHETNLLQSGGGSKSDEVIGGDRTQSEVQTAEEVK
jgi:hypothetical protein